ncbi:MAG: endonuclease/exonuclease/phosphatase family protein [Candidatus Thiodiazotropha sp.]
MTWNIEGLLEKLKFHDIVAYLNQFDIFALSETWMQNIDNVESVFHEYEVYFCAAKKNKSYGRAMAGIIAFVRRRLCENIQRLCDDCDFAIFLQLNKKVLKRDKDILLCFAYLPPDSSPFYEDKDFRGIALLENQILELNTEGISLMLLGDLNARTSDLPDFIQFENNVPELEEFDDILFNNSHVPVRVSCDKTVNKFGRDLLNFCITYSLLIVNSRIGEDKDIGNFTFVSSNGNSVIDYIICSQDLFEEIKHFNIEQRTESAHFPLLLAFNGPENTDIDTHNTDKSDEDTVKTKYIFNNETIEQFRDSLVSLLSENMVQNLCSMIDNHLIHINDILKEFQDILKTCSSGCLQNKRFSKCKQPKWFDAECKTLKAEKYKCLKQFRRSQNMDDLARYKSTRNKFKDLCYKKQQIFNNKQLDSLTETMNDPKSFWKKVKTLVKNTGCNRNNISNDE